MKTLRLLRNLAALFILGAALVVSQAGVGLSHAVNNKACFNFNKVGKNCSFDFTTGECKESPCVKGQPCNNTGCVDFCFFCK